MTHNLDDSLLTALVSGTTTAAVVGTATYPLDLIKTQQQLNNVAAMTRFHIPSNAPNSLAQLFKGGSALVMGNVIKNSARIFLYNWLSNFMALEVQDAKGHQIKKSTAPRMVIAGIMSGFIESLWLIPFENIKVTMIQNMSLVNEISRCKAAGMDVDVTGVSMPNKHHKPLQNIYQKQYMSPHAYFTSEVLSQYRMGGRRGTKFSRHSLSTHVVKHTPKDALRMAFNNTPSLTFLGTVREIYSLKGVRGFAYGGCITLVRQTANSFVWLSSYNWTKQLVAPHKLLAAVGESHWFGGSYTMWQQVGLQIVALAAVIFTTQPIDVVKSHMQLKNSHLAYKDSLSTGYRLVVEQGFGVLYRGALPRGLKVIVSGGLSGSLYSYFERLINAAGERVVFSAES